MTKFFGKVGYAAGKTEAKPGVWKETMVERSHYGDVVRNSRRLVPSQSELNADISVGNSISIMADPYALEHFFAMRYVEWGGVLWAVENVDVERPRLILRLGGVYNGPRPTATPTGTAASPAGGSAGQ